MSNKLRQEMDRIEVPVDLSKRSMLGVQQAKKELQRHGGRFSRTGIITATAGLLIMIGAVVFLNGGFTKDLVTNQQDNPVVMADGSVKIPAIQLPKNTANADMIGLIVYHGKIYTQSRTEISPSEAKALLGEKLGTTKGNIDEWSNQKDYSQELASTTGMTDVFSVKGYDKDFRIMTYQKIDGQIYAQFFEHLNGITIKNGADVFGKLALAGNITSAQFRTFDDWNNSVDHYHSIADLKEVNAFVEELYKAKPLLRSQATDPIGNEQSNDTFRELSLILKDGTKVKLSLLKDGYVYYGFMDAYFQLDGEALAKMWTQLSVPGTTKGKSP